MLCLVDGDLIAYRCAASCENEADAEIIKYRIDDLIYRIMDISQGDSYYVYLTGEHNFRRYLDFEYKANRKNLVPPKYLDKAKEYLTFRWKAVTCIGMEADDAMGVEQCQNPQKSVICSLDKDMLMIPGEHYNWVKDTFTVVTELMGFQHFYKQMLIGDTSDNIRGIHGLGPVKAGRIVDHLDTEQEMFDTIRDLYNDDARCALNLNLLWILQDKDELWSCRSKHLLKSDKFIAHEKEVLSALTSSPIHDSLVTGMMELIGTKHGGISTESTDYEIPQQDCAEETFRFSA